MPQLTINKQYADPVAPTEAQLDAAFNSITSYFNATGIGADNIVAGGITTQLLADNSVTETKIPLQAITEVKLVDGAVTTQKLADTVRNLITPAGLIRAWPGAAAPSGWLLCDGIAVSRDTFFRLFAVIGINFGQGDSLSTFNLPDLRGRSFRGVDGIAGRDPDSAARTASAPGGNTGNNVGSVQEDAFQDHRHNPARLETYATAGTIGGSIAVLRPVALPEVLKQTEYASTRNGADGTRTSSESRAKNAYVNFIIKT